MLADEEPVLPDGPLHPLPTGPPRWMGPNPADPPSVAQPPQANVEHSAVQGEGDSDAAMDDQYGAQEMDSDANLDANGPPVVDPHVVDQEAEDETAIHLKNAPFVAQANTAPAPVIVQVMRPPTSHQSRSVFFHLGLLDISLDTPIPHYLVDPNILRYLACLPDSQPGRVVFGPALPPGGVKLVPYEDSDQEEDYDLKEIEGPITAAMPKKRRAKKLKEPLEKEFVRHSKRKNPDVGGFRDAASAQAAQDYPIIYARPLAVVPPDQEDPYPAASPHLPLDSIQSIGVGFLKMQPSAVSAAALLDLDDE
ncbi:unnamed protein product [Urochloa humidicola]